MNQPLKGKYPSNSGSGLRKPRILVAPLDWGLGHTTRCIPIIRQLLAENADVYLAGNEEQNSLLSTEFPGITIFPLKGYHVRYGSSPLLLLMTLFAQSLKIKRIIRREHSWLKKIVEEYKIDAVISDNRFGLYHHGIPCVFITHQLNIQTPFKKLLGHWARKINYRYINRFSACWVLDNEGDDNLAGELSRPVKKPRVPVHYIGPLSRFEKKEIVEKKNHLVIILSGPEPQRSILENKIVGEISHYNGTATIVRGLPASGSLIPSTNMLRFYNHLPAEELNKEIQQAEFVISRSGYSTIMDLAKLRKKSILIPTPGQTEQEYLMEYLSAKRFAYCISQKKFSLSDALLQARKFGYTDWSVDYKPPPSYLSLLLNF